MGRSFRASTYLALLALTSATMADPVLAQTGPRPTAGNSTQMDTLPGTTAPMGARPTAPQAAPQNGAAPGGVPQSPTAPMQSPGNVKETHGAWSIVCDRPAGAATEQCAMMQNVIAEDRPEVGLSVIVLKTADRKARILRILAPLGVLLKDGMELYVDNNNIGRAYFTRCFSEGCYVEVELDDELMRILRAGKSAVFALRESTDQDRVGIPIQLTGFGEGYDALP
jgi:invasion protein IalB